MALGKGNLTAAEAVQGKVLELDADNREAQVFQDRIRQAPAHERRICIQQVVLFPGICSSGSVTTRQSGNWISERVSRREAEISDLTATSGDVCGEALGANGFIIRVTDATAPHGSIFTIPTS